MNSERFENRLSAFKDWRFYVLAAATTAAFGFGAYKANEQDKGCRPLRDEFNQVQADVSKEIQAVLKSKGVEAWADTLSVTIGKDRGLSCAATLKLK